MNAREHLADLCAQHTGQRHRDALDGGHLDPELAKRGRHLRADEAEPHHHRATRPLSSGANAVTLLDGA